MTELIQTCLARPPREGPMEAGCNVHGCDEQSWTVIEVGGGTLYPGGKASTSGNIIRLCREHARALTEQMMERWFLCESCERWF